FGFSSVLFVIDEIEYSYPDIDFFEEVLKRNTKEKNPLNITIRYLLTLNNCYCLYTGTNIIGQSLVFKISPTNSFPMDKYAYYINISFITLQDIYPQYTENIELKLIV